MAHVLNALPPPIRPPLQFSFSLPLGWLVWLLNGLAQCLVPSPSTTYFGDGA